MMLKNKVALEPSEPPGKSPPGCGRRLLLPSVGLRGRLPRAGPPRGQLWLPGPEGWPTALGN